jgi:macrodomain Ter protein organizer (MatP/YcbG family)
MLFKSFGTGKKNIDLDYFLSSKISCDLRKCNTQTISGAKALMSEDKYNFLMDYGNERS